MKFWDSSAVVPLILEQPRSRHSRALAAADPEMVVWWGSVIECASAISRLRREEQLTAAEERRASTLLQELSSSWYVMQATDTVREQALRVLRVHPLRSADALQLAAAMEWAGNAARGTFITYDERLRDAASREGFTTP